LLGWQKVTLNGLHDGRENVLEEENDTFYVELWAQ
jgi:hypothetical protein